MKIDDNAELTSNVRVAYHKNNQAQERYEQAIEKLLLSSLVAFFNQLGKAVEENVKNVIDAEGSVEQSVSTPSAQTGNQIGKAEVKVNGDDLEASFGFAAAVNKATAGKAGEVQLLAVVAAATTMVGAVEGGKLGSDINVLKGVLSSIGSIYGEQDDTVSGGFIKNLTTGGKFVGDIQARAKKYDAALRGLGKQKKKEQGRKVKDRWLKFSNQGKSARESLWDDIKAFLQRIYDWLFDHRVSVAQESYGARKRRQVPDEAAEQLDVAQESIRKRWAAAADGEGEDGEEPMEVEEDMVLAEDGDETDAQLEAVDAAETLADIEHDTKPIDQLDAEADEGTGTVVPDGIELPAESVEGPRG
ncbi:hypothetical protein SPFM14_00226 [Salmonella phage SPFM14]|nr:hypothetical protein SPFM14_00226 [Salmonella phage SPFM14]